eukprot:8003524-Pyramimonas_sp.AAC.1
MLSPLSPVVCTSPLRPLGCLSGLLTVKPRAYARTCVCSVKRMPTTSIQSCIHTQRVVYLLPTYIAIVPWRCCHHCCHQCIVHVGIPVQQQPDVHLAEYEEEGWTEGDVSGENDEQVTLFLNTIMLERLTSLPWRLHTILDYTILYYTISLRACEKPPSNSHPSTTQT